MTESNEKFDWKFVTWEIDECTPSSVFSRLRKIVEQVVDQQNVQLDAEDSDGVRKPHMSVQVDMRTDYTFYVFQPIPSDPTHGPTVHFGLRDGKVCVDRDGKPGPESFAVHVQESDTGQCIVTVEDQTCKLSEIPKMALENLFSTPVWDLIGWKAPGDGKR